MKREGGTNEMYMECKSNRHRSFRRKQWHAKARKQNRVYQQIRGWRGTISGCGHRLTGMRHVIGNSSKSRTLQKPWSTRSYRKNKEVHRHTKIKKMCTRYFQHSRSNTEIWIFTTAPRSAETCKPTLSILNMEAAECRPSNCYIHYDMCVRVLQLGCICIARHFLLLFGATWALRRAIFAVPLFLLFWVVSPRTLFDLWLLALFVLWRR